MELCISLGKICFVTPLQTHKILTHWSSTPRMKLDSGFNYVSLIHTHPVRVFRPLGCPGPWGGRREEQHPKGGAGVFGSYPEARTATSGCVMKMERTIYVSLLVRVMEVPRTYDVRCPYAMIYSLVRCEC